MQSPVVYSVPTHLREREPFAFGRTLGEVAKLVVVGYLLRLANYSAAGWKSAKLTDEYFRTSRQ